MRRLKVYAWTGVDDTFVVAARSKAEVGRIYGQPPRRLFNLEETGNEVEEKVALRAPGTIFRHNPYTMGDRSFFDLKGNRVADRNGEATR